MTSYHQCVSCTKTYEQEHCATKTDGNLICPHCLEEVEFAFSVCTAEAVEDLKKDCADHWEMTKASVFVILFLVWVCFAVWGKYVS